MIDKKTSAVLKVLATESPNGYTVLDKQHLLSLLPKKLNIDMETFCSILMFLKENEFVDVKYQDKNSVCLCTTVKAQNNLEGLQETENTKLAGKQVGMLFFGIFLCAFLGAFLAIALYNLIF